MTATTTTFSGVAAADPIRSTAPGITNGAVRNWLRLEGLAALVAGLALFGAGGGNWLFVIPLLLLPDLSAAGYLVSRRVGAITYNVAHNWAPGLVVLGLGFGLAMPALQLPGAILIAHVGMDRAAGYGLKLPTAFGDTHLGRIGRSKA